jgi:hypothetical protein
LNFPTYTNVGLVLLQKSVGPKLVGKNPQKRNELGFGRLSSNKKCPPVLEINVLILSSWVEPLKLKIAMELSPVRRRRWHIFQVLSPWQ